MSLLQDDFLNYQAKTTPHPLGIEVKRAKGSYITANSGKKYLDFVAGVSACTLGHCHPKVVSAIRKQAKKYMHVMVYGEFAQEPARTDEGNALEKDFIKRITLIEDLLRSVVKTDPERNEKIEQKLRSALEDLKIEVDANRFEQELIFYLEKFDITEEKVRLKNHLDYFKQVMQNDFPNGKKLGFIAQEIGREINTIGSKANHSELQKIVVQMKDELEKIKEQLLNVL